MAYNRQYPQNFTPKGTKTNEALANDDNEIKQIYGILNNHEEGLSSVGEKSSIINYESTGAGIISGFDATVSGSTINIKAGTVHMVTGYRETTADTNIPLNAADATNPRTDLIYLSNTGVVSYLEGTAAVSPSVPGVPTGGVALWSSLITTTGTITLMDLRNFKARYQNMGMVSVMDFVNVTGDGTTDDTTAIQKAIDYCAAKDLPLKFPRRSYRVTQIVLRNKGRYYFEKGSIIIKSANVCAVVNESIDNFGSGTSYTTPDSVLTADAADAMDTIYVDGLTVKKATSNYQMLTYAQQCSYKGYKWVVSASVVSDFPVNFVGLRDSTIKNVTITDLQGSANINLGFSLRTVVVDCILHQGIDGCLQFFACVQCAAKSNRCKNGGGGMIAFQACNRCLALGNLITYDATLSFTPVNYQCLAIKGCLNCVAFGNIIDGTSAANSQGITVTYQDGESHNNTIANNSIRNCDLGLCNDDTSTTGTVFANNTLLNCGKTSNTGSISLVAGYGIVIKGNTVRGSISHNVWISSGVNFVNIKDNLFEETASYMSMVLFYDGNTTTTSYNIRDNIMRNAVTNTNVRGIMFAAGTSPLYNDNQISENVFSGIGDVLRLSTTKAGATIFQQSDIWTTLPLSIRHLSDPTVFDSGPFTVTRTAAGIYTITLGASVSGSLFRVRSVQASYKLGYSPSNFNGCRIGIAYDDYGNANRSVNAINLTLTDTNGNLTDNPTSNGNAAALYNFGLDLLITYQIDPSGI